MNWQPTSCRIGFVYNRKIKAPSSSLAPEFKLQSALSLPKTQPEFLNMRDAARSHFTGSLQKKSVPLQNSSPVHMANSNGPYTR